MNDPKIRFIFFDLETTGGPNQGSIFHEFHRIVQISAVSGNETFDAIVNPECHVPTESTAIHRVSNSDTKEAPSFRFVFPQFRAFVKKQAIRGTKMVLIAHNAFGFDKFILEKECDRFGMRLPPNWLFYDTLQKYRSQYPELLSKKLGNIYKLRFDEDLSGAHNSLADSLALKRLFEADILPYFTLEDTIAVKKQNYLNNSESVIKIRGIGEKTRNKIKKVLTILDPTIGDIRNYLSGCSFADIEVFIRTQMNTYKEAFVFSILCEITQPENPHLLFKNFPFIEHSFTISLPTKSVEKLQKKYHIRSAEQLKRYYLFKLQENGDLWDKLLLDLNVNPFMIAMLMRSL